MTEASVRGRGTELDLYQNKAFGTSVPTLQQLLSACSIMLPAIDRLPYRNII